MTSSRFSPITGMRLKPLRSASDIAWRSVLWRSMKTTSVRGTITSRTIVSPSSKTEWIIARSPDSMTWLASARSTSSRSSASEENGPSLKPLPGVRVLPTRISSCGSGPRIRVEDHDEPGAEQRDPLGVLPAEVRGPDADRRRTRRRPSTQHRDEHREPASSSKSRATTSATSTMAVISQSIRRNSAVLR